MKVQRYVQVLDKAIPLAAYIAAVKIAKAHPDTMFKHGLTTWWSTSGAEIVQQFNAGVQDRINQAVPYIMRGTIGH